MQLEETSVQQWVKLRASAVRAAYTAYDCLMEHGFGDYVPDASTPVQVPCPFHGPDRRPSARYYSRQGSKHDYVRCFKCRENWDSIALHGKFTGKRWMDALVDLERRLRIRIPRKPDGPSIVEPSDRGSDYISDEWRNIPRVLSLLESRLIRLRNKCGMTDYVKFCRLLDAIQFDWDKTEKSTPEMVSALQTLRGRLDEVAALPEDLFGEEL